MFAELARLAYPEKHENMQPRYICAIEGPVCSGKSTLIRNLSAQCEVPTIPEYMDVPCKPNMPSGPFPATTTQQARENLSYFLGIEAKRREIFNAADSELFLLDRSIYTLISFELGVYSLSGVDIVSWAMDRANSSKQIIVPDEVIYLDVSSDVAMQRASRANMRTPKFLFSSVFNDGARSFYEALNSAVPGYVKFVDANGTEEETLEAVKKVIYKRREVLGAQV